MLVNVLWRTVQTFVGKDLHEPISRIATGPRTLLHRAPNSHVSIRAVKAAALLCQRFADGWSARGQSSNAIHKVDLGELEILNKAHVPYLWRELLELTDRLSQHTHNWRAMQESWQPSHLTISIRSSQQAS